MRFDDRLTTVLKGSLPEGAGAATQWRQVIDLLAQKPAGLANEDVQAGLTRLRDLHERVSEQDRVTAVQSLNGRLRSAPLLVYLTADSDAVCDAAMAAADLSPEICADAFPRLSPRAQQILRAQGFAVAEEQPVAPAEEDALPHENGADTDVAKESSAEPSADAAEKLAESQISALVEKIADYQKNRPAEMPRAPVSDSGSKGFLPNRSRRSVLKPMNRVRSTGPKDRRWAPSSG
ncbi:hypothetical protein C8024_15820 [Sphingopyxis sp. BSNA05]|uniref:hypothetical protein n=1 Tax=Sphingopyxis sp. BSNA05 TaxID=1236614 RepID=UPI00156703E6|nr:hypothetical protein [Sphingopyxis sp. BSNA05]NRD90610.1 hypothetical protein [Sphingopyxis sp. BSNA05]